MDGKKKASSADSSGSRKKAKRSAASSSSDVGPADAKPREPASPQRQASGAAATPPAAAATTTPTSTLPTTPPAAFPSEESLPHLCCSICLSFPEGEVLQCASGHILCRDCHDRVSVEDKPACPTCRVALDPLKPIRNVLAEQTISLLPVACPNEPCAAKLTRGSLSTHLKAECPHRAVTCKYAPLGCKWEGIAEQCSRHEDRCKKAELPGWKLLKKVCLRETQQAEKAAAEKAEGNVGLRMIEMLSGRCKNAELSHVVLHKCSAHEHVAGKPAHLVSAAFHALGFRWKVFTVHDPAGAAGAGTYSAVLQLRDHRLPLPVDLFVLRGPGTEAGLKPATHSHTFVAKHRSTEPLLLAEGDAATACEQLESLNLRVGLVDRRTGRLSRGFLGQSTVGHGWAGGPEDEEASDWDEVGSGSEEEDLGDSDSSISAYFSR